MDRPPLKPTAQLSGKNREVNRLLAALGGLRPAAEWFQVSEETIRSMAANGRLSAQKALWVAHCRPGEFDPLDLSPRTADIPEHLRVLSEDEV